METCRRITHLCLVTINTFNKNTSQYDSKIKERFRFLFCRNHPLCFCRLYFLSLSCFHLFWRLISSTCFLLCLFVRLACVFPSPLCQFVLVLRVKCSSLCPSLSLCFWTLLVSLNFVFCLFLWIHLLLDCSGLCLQTVRKPFCILLSFCFCCAAWHMLWQSELLTGLHRSLKSLKDDNPINEILKSS